MQSKKLFDNGTSYIAITKGKMLVINSNNTGYSPLAIRITEGFQVELGRDIRQVIEAMKFTRLPIIIKKIPIISDTMGSYQIIRMHTGKVDDKIIANISTINNIVKSISFNRALITDSDYRRYNQLSVLHQLSISDKKSNVNDSVNRAYRIEQVKNALRSIIIPGAKNVSVIEDDNQIIFNILVNKNTIKLVFIHNSDKKSYDLVSISLV